MNKGCDLNLTSNKPSRAEDDITYYSLHITQCVGTINEARPMTITKPTPVFVKQMQTQSQIPCQSVRSHLKTLTCSSAHVYNSSSSTSTSFILQKIMFYINKSPNNYLLVAG